MKATNTMKAKCGHNDLFGYFANTYCKACADKGWRSVVQPTQQDREDVSQDLDETQGK